MATIDAEVLAQPQLNSTRRKSRGRRAKMPLLDGVESLPGLNVLATETN
jgi:hypothetical protein